MNILAPDRVPRKIDAHVHLMPPELEGTTDERFGITMGPYGLKMFPNGMGAPFLPNFMEKSSFTKEALIHVMDWENVERAVIMQSLCLKANPQVAEAVAAYPDRLRGAMVIEPKDEGVLDEIRGWAEKGLTVIKFEMSEPFGFTHPNAYPDLNFDSPLMNRLYDLAGELGLTVTIDTSPIGAKGYQAENLHRAVQKHTDTKFVICHLCFPRIGLRDEPGPYAEWLRMSSLAQYDNVWIDLAAMPSIFRDEEYPYPSAAGFLRDLMDRYGSKKPVWGSDIPGTYVDATYREMKNMYLKCSLFTQEELENIFWNNALQVYFDGK